MTQTRMSDSTPELNLEGGEDQRIHTLILLPSECCLYKTIDVLRPPYKLCSLLVTVYLKSIA